MLRSRRFQVPCRSKGRRRTNRCSQKAPFSIRENMLKYAQVITYDTILYPFAKVLSAYVFKVPQINKLHDYYSKQKGVEKLAYSDNLILRRLMQELPDDSLFYKVYHFWMKEVIAPKYGHKISYSAHPKMR